MGTKNLFTVPQFSEKHQAFSEGSLRWKIFQSKPRKSSNGTIPPNEFGEAFVQVGGRVLIDEDMFFSCIDRNNSGEKTHE